jgi:eukaryotic-like serine/threonine-protein kinase
VRTEFRELTAKKYESALGNRFRRKMVHAEEEFDKEAYDLIMSAMTAETTGQLRRAVECWTAVRDRLPVLDVKQYTDEAAVRQAAWRWVAEKRLADIAAGRATLEQIRKTLADDRLDERFRTYPPGDLTGQATRAVRYSDYGDTARANLEWDAIARQTENDLDQRRWFTLATEQRALSATAAGKEEQARQDRLKTITNNLQAATTLWEQVKSNPEARVQRRDVRNTCRDIIDLYADDTTPAVVDLVQSARKLQEAAR